MIPARRRAGTAVTDSVHPPFAPMLAKSVDTAPEAPGVAYEPKWDGWRALAFRRPNGVYLQSRAGRDLSSYFPDITEAVSEAVPAGAALDGELVVWEGERTNFSLLQRRVTAGAQLPALIGRHPAHYVVFDLLRAPSGRPLLDTPLMERRALLEQLLADAPAPLTLSPQTTDLERAVEWLHTWTAAGIEGLMIKRLDGRYEPGRRGWQKLRAYRTTEAIIGGVTPTIDNPQTLLLGRVDQHGRLRYTGRTSPLRPAQRTGLAALLTADDPTSEVKHPWPQPLPAAWSGQLEQPQPLPYARVTPTVVAEIDVDTAYEQHRWRHHVRYLRPRLDLSATDVPPLEDHG
ncbi:ATP-dependent DNA ligase [Micromonospora sp. NPDC049497]|uniref:ATP-dependent DNA ligase n=1 Tax=Micromonospora sp. NPDC049497 TaxID=3364273 RepID=UPI00379C65F3